MKTVRHTSKVMYDPSGTIWWIQTSLARHYGNLPTDRSDKGATGKQATLKAVTVKLDSMRSELLHTN
jgi:hypothetical protein